MLFYIVKWLSNPHTNPLVCIFRLKFPTLQSSFISSCIPNFDYPSIIVTETRIKVKDAWVTLVSVTLVNERSSFENKGRVGKQMYKSRGGSVFLNLQFSTWNTMLANSSLCVLTWGYIYILSVMLLKKSKMLQAFRRLNAQSGKNLLFQCLSWLTYFITFNLQGRYKPKRRSLR